MTSKPFPALTVLALLTLLLTACASRDIPAGQQPNSTGSAQPASTGRPQPTPSTTPVPCPYDGTPITVRRGDQPAPVCVHPGDVLTITAPPAPTQPWNTPTSSNPAVLACTTRHLADGALIATCRALAAGTVTVATTTAPFAGDPHGPAQYTWTLTVHITPAG